jgi:hypothetical protein
MPFIVYEFDPAVKYCLAGIRCDPNKKSTSCTGVVTEQYGRIECVKLFHTLRPIMRACAKYKINTLRKRPIHVFDSSLHTTVLFAFVPNTL